MSGEIALRDNSIPDLAKIAGELTTVSKGSRETYKYAMNSWVNFCKSRGIEQNFDAIPEWLESVSPATRVSYLAAMKNVLKKLYQHDPRYAQMRLNLDDIKIKKSQHRAVTKSMYLTKEEVAKLIKKCPKHIGLMVQTLFYTGLRISELLNIELKHCILEKNVYEIRVIGKRSKEACVFLEKKFFESLKMFFKGEKLLFCHGKSQKKFNRTFISQEIHKYGLLIGKNMSAHNLRHSYAMYLVNDRKLSIDKVQRAMNHGNSSTTIAFYLHNKPTPEELGIVPTNKRKK